MLLIAVGSCTPPLDPIEPRPAPRQPPPRIDVPPAPEPEPIPVDPAPPGPSSGIGPLVKVALAAKMRTHKLDAEGNWRLMDARGGVLVRANRGESWEVQLDGNRMRGMRSDGMATSWGTEPITQFADEGDGFLKVGGKRYRGGIQFVISDSGLIVINEIPLEDYLRGVVPLEIGNRRADERAAVEAQAVAARSFTVQRASLSRSGRGRSRDFDMVASVADQVYGGLDAETPLSDQGVFSTAGLVLLTQGRIATTPFHSTCGGETAAAEEVWQTAGEPHLRRVSDRIPGTDRHYCDISPRFAWTRVLSGSELDVAVSRYLSSVVSVGRGGPGNVRSVTVDAKTPSGRVGALVIRAANGSYRVRGNDARSVLRSPSGELLNSPYFSVTTETGSAGRIARVIIRGNGYGHGVGMCQWGAIGRARAGQDFRTILRTYYPGTTLNQIPPGLITQ